MDVKTMRDASLFETLSKDVIAIIREQWTEPLPELTDDSQGIRVGAKPLWLSNIAALLRNSIAADERTRIIGQFLRSALNGIRLVLGDLAWPEAKP
jgi:hypothetical protein